MCTPRELDYVEAWLDEDPQHSRILQDIMKDLHNDAAVRTDRDSVKQYLNRKIGSQLKEQNRPVRSRYLPSAGRNKPAIRMKAIAACLVFITAFIFSQYLNQEVPEAQEEEIYTLQERQLPYGQTATLRFSDGSVIMLNGGSSLKYPERFNPGLREVYLEGEAYFEIESDSTRPFIVHVGNTRTRVLGTSFNIRAYPDGENIQVAVVEGKVGVSSSAGSEDKMQPGSEVVLGENEWARYLHSGGLKDKGRGNIREQVAWKDHVLLFNNKPFSEVARMLERWYGVEITIHDEQLQKTVLEGEHNDVSLRTVLESIKFVLDIEYTMKEGEVEIMPGS